MNTVGWAFMYEVLCTCITAPLEGLFVDKAKYSENVGHHLVCRIFEIQWTGKGEAYQNKSVATRAIKNQVRTDATNGTRPLTRPQFRGCEMDNRVGLEISENSAYLNW